MKEEKKYSGSKTRNYFTAYLLASIQGRRLRYLEKQQKILFAEENLEDKEITDIDISLEERLELEKKEQLLLDESKGIYPEWNEMTDMIGHLGLTSSTYYRYRKNFYEIFPEFLQSV